ncbi:YopT-type cysteine protease domain-containing protein [Rhizobium grahamii]|uniref:Peptidase C58 YopT-type domain-containing protein n=1 Tax=Rhizobium grahamii TaxID=1120045 RepID=A0A370KH89_9HYPH|nr:YopT-type cysteine protease domain-containing protein [Rhizobium grahamii]RDJ04504.1 hypothetical protein B5K06_27070 [Rhizobium grahamii]
MLARINESFQCAGQACEPNVHSDKFAATLEEIASQSALASHASSSSAPARPYSFLSQPPALDLMDKMGLCASRPHTSDAPNRSSSSSNLSILSPRESISIFPYITAELRDANRSGICIGLSTQWLRNIHTGNPSARMDALTQGTQGHESAAALQQRCEELKNRFRDQGAGASQAKFRALRCMLQEVGFRLAAKAKYAFPSDVARMINGITEENSAHLLSFSFADGNGHTVATATSNGMTTLFDPNYGEFTVQPNQLSSLFQSLSNRYLNPNALDLRTITAQRVSRTDDH